MFQIIAIYHGFTDYREEVGIVKDGKRVEQFIRRLACRRGVVPQVSVLKGRLPGTKKWFPCTIRGVAVDGDYQPEEPEDLVIRHNDVPLE